MSYVYIMSEPGLLTVGFYDPQGKWHADSDHDTREGAAARVAFLNGSARESKEDSDESTRKMFARLIPTLGPQ